MADPVMLQSAVRVPTPPPGASYSPQPSASRKRSPPSRSPSPNRRRSPPAASFRDVPDVPGIDSDRAVERERQLAERLRRHEKQEAARKPLTEEEKQASAKAEYDKLLNMRSGGTYIPPARLRALQSHITDKSSKEYQRMAWEALKKSVNGLINKVNTSNIKHIVPELFGENLVRGRGLFCRSIMKAQAASLPFTPIYAAMAAIVNTKLPQVGELLLSRLIVQFRKAFKRNDKAVCISSTTFMAHLCNHQVAHEILAAEILWFLLKDPTDDSVEIAVGLTREVGQHLEEMSAPIALTVFDRFRSILHEADIDKRVQYMVEVLFQVRKDRYKNNPAVKEELDLVEEEDQITHRIGLLDEGLDTQDGLNIFKYDEKWEEHEEAYKRLRAEILGEGTDEEDEEDEETDESSDEESDEERRMDIKDRSNADLVNLRRTIYLTIMSSIDFEECCHKLMKINLPPGLEHELPSMIIECCSQERTYSKFYGLIGERFSKINRLWCDLFESAFAKYYDTIHRYETNRLRNIASFFGHMLSTDAIGWHVLSVIHLNEEETTSSSRIFIKILFQDLGGHLGLPKLRERFTDEILRPSFAGIFPMENPRHTRFAINYFTSIGFGFLTEEMREHLKNIPRPAPAKLPAPAADSDSESVSSHGSCSTCTGSRSRSRSRSYSYSRSPSRSRSRGRSYTRSASVSSRGRSYTRSYTPSRSRSPVSRKLSSYSRSRSPSYRDRSRSVSRKPARRTRDRSNGSRSPVARRNSYKSSRSPSRSVTPPRQGRNGYSRRDRSYSKSVSRSISPAPRRGHTSRGRRYSSTSVSPPARKRAGRRSISVSRSPSASRSRRGGRNNPQRRYSESVSRSPSPPPRRRRRSPSRTPPRTQGNRVRAADYI